MRAAISGTGRQMADLDRRRRECHLVARGANWSSRRLTSI
jgi:hypothetical protein